LNDLTKDIFGLLTLFVMVALVALLVGHAAATGSLVQVSGDEFNQALNTVELSGSAADTGYSETSNSLTGNSNVLGSF